MSKFQVGQTVRVTNSDLQSFGMTGEVINVSMGGGVQVKLSRLGDSTVCYGVNSLEVVNKREALKPLSKNIIGLFFETHKNAKQFLEDGSFYSEDGLFDVFFADSMKDCAAYYERMEHDNPDAFADLDFLVFGGKIYDINASVTFTESTGE